MKIKIDGKEIIVKDPSKNIVEIADENGIKITAPCFRSEKKYGCCNACVIEADGAQKYACGTRPAEGMNIIYQRDDLAQLRKERREKYAKGIKSGDYKANSCSCGGASGCSCS